MVKIMGEADIAARLERDDDKSSVKALNRKRPLAAQVYEVLRKRIIALEFKPGATISKAVLADSMGISQTPVREAILRLEEEGLVDVYPQSRTIVTLLDLRQARELQIMRSAIESQLAKAIATKADEQLIETLADTISTQTAALKSEDFEAFAKADAAFHEAQYRFCDVAGLWDVVTRRRGHMDRFRRLHLPVHDKERQVLSEHRKIFKAIRSKKPDAAEEATRYHLSRTFAVTDQIVTAFPEYFLPDTEAWIETLRSTPRILEGGTIM